jgi:type VI secretion system secreted protein VgrG
MENVELEIAGASHFATGVRGTLELSRLPRFEVSASTEGEAPAAPGDLVGQVAKLTVRDAFGGALVFHGLVIEAERLVSSQGGGDLRVTLGAEVEQLTVGRDVRYFQELAVPDIVTKVLEGAGVDMAHVRLSLSGSYPTRPYTAQHRESDWAFVERLLAEEGIYFWLELGDDSTTLVVSDDSTSAPELVGGAELVYEDGSRMRTTKASLARVRARSALRSTGVRLRDYDPDKPAVPLDEKAGEPALEIYDYPGRFSEPPVGKSRATARLEALRADALLLFGETAVARVQPGLVFELVNHTQASLDGRYLVRKVELEADRRRGASLAITAQPASVRFRPPCAWPADPARLGPRARTERPRFAHRTGTTRGPETGVVVGPPGAEIHTDDRGRVRVEPYWDRQGARDDRSSTWMRVGQLPLGGSMIVPRVGWDVLVHHVEDDCDAPTVTGHLYDGQHPVPYALPANKTRTAWQTATTPGGGSSNEVRYEDKAGSEEVFIHASKDMNVTVGDTRTEKVGVDLTETIGGDLTEKTGDNLDTSIIGSQSVSIGGDQTLTVGASRGVTVKGSEKTTIGGSRTATLLLGSSLDAKGGRSLDVGGTRTAVSALEHGRTALGTMSVTVAGSWIAAAGSGLDDKFAGAASETVAGVKLHLGVGGCETKVGGALAENVGGAYVAAAGGGVAESATSAMAITVGGALALAGPEIEIEGETEISVRAGGASLTIKPGSIELKAPLIAAPGATITKKAGSIKHN